ncbi:MULTISPECIES: ribosome silencing factor [unclassified Agrococcus]|uniref:ribosome silencing factor n=1 Tax=unclassified Agrococcus TaxID=2615065 RepID=UPI003620001E
MTATHRSIELVQAAAKAADGVMGTDLVGLDVSERLPLTDAFLLATGTSERQVSAIARAIEDDLFDLGAKPLRREGRADGRWVLIDLGDLVVHVFHEEERQYYQLERLWRDCPVIPLDLPTAD